MIFISHHLEETFAICDRISILKDGQYMGTYEVKDMNEDKVIRLMVGREMSEMFPPQTIKPKDNVILEAKGITNVNVKDVSFQVHEGEILGLAGLVGAGRTELARAIFGADHKNAGEIIMEGKTVNISKPLDAIKNGIGFVTENRKEEGLHLNFSLSYNIMLPNLKKIQKGLCRLVSEAISGHRPRPDSRNDRKLPDRTIVETLHEPSRCTKRTKETGIQCKEINDKINTYRFMHSSPLLE